MKKFKMISIVLAFLVLALSMAQPCLADEKVEQLFKKIEKVNNGLKDYQANINIALKAKVAFLPYNPTMSGTYYHKAPDKHKLVLEKAPSYVKKYPNIFGWNLPKLHRFNSRIAGETTINGKNVWHLYLVPKEGMGDVISVEMWVNQKDYTVVRQTTNYKNDGKLTVDVNYTVLQGYHVFDKMTAEFSFPKVAVHATASASYTNYLFNQGLSDSFFAKDKK